MTTRHRTPRRSQNSKITPDGHGATDELDRLRTRIRELDRSLVQLIAERVDLARQIGAAKREAGIGTLDPAQEAAVVRHAGTLARDADLDPEDVRPLFWRLIGLSRRAQLTASETKLHDPIASYGGST